MGKLKKHILVMLSCLFAILITNLSFPFFPEIAMPSFILCCIFLCKVKDLKSLSPLTIFFLGIINDSVAGYPIGFSSLLWIGFSILISYIPHIIKRNFSEFEIFINSFIFFIISMLFWLSAWILLSLYNWQIENIIAFLIQWILTSISYIMLHFLYITIRNHKICIS